MAEVKDSAVVSSTSETKENDGVSTSEPLPQNDRQSTSPTHLNRECSQQPSTADSSVSGGNNGSTSERRRKLLAEAEHQKTEQRRLQMLESQRRAEAQREKQKEERKRRIEETRQRDEARQRKAQETKMELDRRYRDHMQNLLQRNRERTVANPDQHRQPPAIMRASHMNLGPSKQSAVSSASSDRMATSFTVAFGSSVPRFICTKANEAALRSQAAFEARLASYLNGRHSGCFLTQSSAYTTYALYVKPDLLPEDHPIRKQHQQQERHSYAATSTTPRRSASANPGLQRHSGPTQTPGKGSPITRAGRGAPPPEILTARTGKPNSAAEEVATLPQRRAVPGRSGVSRDRCNSYAAPTTASINRQRAISHDQKPAHDNFSPASSASTTLSHRKPSVPNALEGRGRSQKRAAPATTAEPAEPVKVADKPAPNNQSKPVPIKKPATVMPAETEPATAQSSEPKPAAPPPGSPPAAIPSVSPVVSTLAHAARYSSAPPVSLADELSGTQAESPAEPQQGPHSPPPMSLAAELDSAALPPREETPVSKEAADVESPPPSADEDKEPVPAEKEPEAVPEVTSTVVDVEDANKADRKPTLELREEEPQPESVVVTAAACATEEKEAAQASRKSTPPPGPLPSGPIKASTTGSGEGGCLPEEEAAIYRAKMAEQRRLAKERLAEQERREAEEERQRNERREAERQAAIQAARERAIEEARLAAESRQAREAAEQEARLQAEREAQERAARDRQRLEAIERERLENFRRAEEERAMRKKRLDSIMSRVNRSDRSLSRGVANSESSNSLPGMMSTSVTNAGGDQPGMEGEPKPPVHFSLGHGRESADSTTTVPSQNGFSNGYPKFTSPILQSLLSGSSRFSGDHATSTAASSTATSGVSSDTRLPDGSQDPPQHTSPSHTSFPVGTVGNGSNS